MPAQPSEVPFTMWAIADLAVVITVIVATLYLIARDVLGNKGNWSVTQCFPSNSTVRGAAGERSFAVESGRRRWITARTSPPMSALPIPISSNITP